jgi:hypothetical protein
MKLLMKICRNCGRKIPQGTKCNCHKNFDKTNERHKLYNQFRRDQDKNKFYHSAVWGKLIEAVKARAHGLDELALAEGRIEKGNTVHHIYPIDDRPDLKTSLDNMIYLSARNHNRVHKKYQKDSISKKTIQEKLSRIAIASRAGGSQKSF